MSVEMITAIGAFLLGVAGILSAILVNAKTVAVLQTEIKEMKQKLDVHNGYAEKFAETTKSIGKMETDIAVIKTKLDFIAKEVNE